MYHPQFHPPIYWTRRPSEAKDNLIAKDVKDQVDLQARCHDAITSAVRYSVSSMKDDSHWSGEVRSNITLTAEYIFLYHYLNLPIQGTDRSALKQYLLSQQRPLDGSWGIAQDNHGDVSVSSEAYLALKLLGEDPSSPSMKLARAFIVSKGGLASIRVFTRIYFAMFGLMSWDSVPQLAPELILLPKSSFVGIYRFSSWARATLVPLMVIAHHRPIFALPNGRSANSNYLDELWVDSANKSAPYAPALIDLVKQQNWIGLGATIADSFMSYQTAWGILPFRQTALQKCMEWILERQEPSGDWAGIFPPLHASIMAMFLEGISISDPRMVRAMQAVERFAISDRLGKRVQPCVSAGWDTALMTIGLLDCSPVEGREAPAVRAQVDKAIAWIKGRQTLGAPGDWRMYRPLINAGGFSFEYHNSWYPDIDDTQTAVIAIIKADPTAISSDCVLSALEWLLGMQNKDGGWAGFDCDNDKLYLNAIPFSDMEAFCDPSTSDVTGGVVECFGLVMQAYEANKEKSPMAQALLTRMELAAARALKYLVEQQESDGSWWGRWGCNYLYGTCNVLWGLEHFRHRAGHVDLDPVINRALEFLGQVQNEDGGWGESTLSYDAPKSSSPYSPLRRFGHRESFPARHIASESNPSQTAWAVMALLAYLPSDDARIQRGVRWLLDNQSPEGHGGLVNGFAVGERSGRSWQEPLYTATGFPGHMMLGYEFYSHYWPMMALGRFVKSRGKQAE
jgi:squalene-hopene/tetraprenyl-beta-curcumene cyclase